MIKLVITIHYSVVFLVIIIAIIPHTHICTLIYIYIYIYIYISRPTNIVDRASPLDAIGIRIRINSN